MNNQDNLNYPNKDSNKNLNDEADECLDDLFKSTFNVEDLINKDNQKEPKVINEDFSLDKALAQSKVNININEDIENKFLVNRVWDCTDDNKIQYLENKVENIYRELDKGKIKSLISQIKRIDLQQKFYSDFDPRQNKTTIGSISGLDFLVENTFFCQEKYYENMILDRDELKQYLYKVRNVLGDGDCFYRGFIFSLMENIILTNNIMQMKELLILYHEKINLKNKLIDEKTLCIFAFTFQQRGSNTWKRKTSATSASSATATTARRALPRACSSAPAPSTAWARSPRATPSATTIPRRPAVRSPLPPPSLP